jgi:hypothetical protein
MNPSTTSSLRAPGPEKWLFTALPIGYEFAFDRHGPRYTKVGDWQVRMPTSNAVNVVDRDLYIDAYVYAFQGGILCLPPKQL